MICRLCLSDLFVNNAIQLFDSSGNIAETQLLKLIAKYLQLELTFKDSISTFICQECCKHLEDFHEFWMLVDQKQNSLRSNEFFEVKCVLESSNIVSLPIDEKQFVEHNEEPLLDFKNVLSLGCAEITENVDSALMAELDIPPAAMCCDKNKTFRKDTSDDDDIPLYKLLRREKIKKKKIKSKKDKNVQLQKKIKYKQEEKEVSEIKEQRDKLGATQQNVKTIEDFMQMCCELCSLMAQNLDELRLHFKVMHQREPYLRCCNKIYPLRKSSKLVEHINWHRDPESYRCDICQKVLRTKRYLKFHKQLKHGIIEGSIFQCHLCNKKFQGQKCLENHIRRHDKEKDLEHSFCDTCQKSYVTPQRLRRHIEAIHENLFAHICDTCGKKFKNKPSFERHVREHQGIIDPPVQCSICGKWAKNSSALRLHSFTHNGTAKCHLCGRTCPSRAALRGHITYTHKLERSLKCSYCDKTFKVVKNLQEHMAIHTGAQIYSCPHCSKECRSKANMYVHIKRAHMQEWLTTQRKRSNDPSYRADLQQPQLENN